MQDHAARVGPAFARFLREVDGGGEGGGGASAGAAGGRRIAAAARRRPSSAARGVAVDLLGNGQVWFRADGSVVGEDDLGQERWGASAMGEEAMLKALE